MKRQIGQRRDTADLSCVPIIKIFERWVESAMPLSQELMFLEGMIINRWVLESGCSGYVSPDR